MKNRFSQVIEVPFENIRVSPNDFQGRQSEYSEDTVQAIVSKGFYDKSAEPIVVWEDDRVTLPGNYIVISGHSRFEAIKRLRSNGASDLDQIPVKIFNGTLQDAREYAVLESNRGGTEEGLLSDIKAFKLAKNLGKNKAWLKGNFRPESKFEKLDKLSYLADKGRFIEALTSSASNSYPYIERNATWVGTLRKMLPALTDAHENEIFTWMYQGDRKALAMSKEKFMNEVDKRVNRIDFNPDKPLNFANAVSANPYIDPLNEQIKDIEREIDKLGRERDKQLENIKRANAEAKQELIPKFRQRISDIDTLVLRKMQEQDKIRASIGNLERNTVADLFSMDDEPEPAPKTQPKQNTKTDIVIPPKKLLHTFTHKGETFEVYTVWQRPTASAKTVSSRGFISKAPELETQIKLYHQGEPLISGVPHPIKSPWHYKDKGQVIETLDRDFGHLFQNSTSPKKITREEYNKLPKYRKGIVNGTPYMSYLGNHGGTVYGPVTFVETDKKQPSVRGIKKTKTLQEYKNQIERYLDSLELKYDFSGESLSNGKSIYYEAALKDSENFKKIRFSNHDATNPYRMANEIMFGLEDFNTPKLLYELGHPDYEFGPSKFITKNIEVLQLKEGQKAISSRITKKGNTLYTVQIKEPTNFEYKKKPSMSNKNAEQIKKLEAAMNIPGISDEERKIYQNALAKLKGNTTMATGKTQSKKEDSAKYFKANADAKFVRLDTLTVLKKNPRKSIDTAKARMKQAAAGEMEKRAPINIYRQGNQWIVADGNATTVALQEMGYTHVPAIIVSAPNEGENYVAFYNGEKHEFKAESLYAAKKAAIKHFNVPKSKESILAVEYVGDSDNSASPKTNPIDQNPEDIKDAQPPKVAQKVYDKDTYKGVFGDFDGDGILNVDDPNPRVPGDKETVEEIKLSDEIAALIDFRKKGAQTEKEFVEVLRKKAQGETDILSRTKTPYSIVNKMRRKMTAGPNDGLTDLVGTMVVFGKHSDIENFRDKVNRGELGQVLEFDDYYTKPKAGYMAYHWNVVYKGSPVEIQVKSERLKKIAGYTHTLYKTGKHNAQRQLELSQLAVSADKGDKAAAAQIDDLLADKNKVIAFLTGDEKLKTSSKTSSSKTSSSKTSSSKTSSSKTSSSKTSSSKTSSSKTKPITKKQQLAKQQEELKAYQSKIAKAQKNGLSKSEVIRIANKINSTRRLASMLIDGAQDHKDILAPTEDNLRRWAKNPGKYDLQGVDTATDKEPTKKFKKPYAPRKRTWWDQLWDGDN